MPPGCPECESARIEPRSRSEHRWRCKDCDATFDDPTEIAGASPRGRTARKLAAMDADDLVTDGGVDTIQACPECDSSQIEYRARPQKSVVDTSASHFCTDCGARFDQPHRREPETHANAVHGLANDLLEMDPDGVSG